MIALVNSLTETFQQFLIILVTSSVHMKDSFKMESASFKGIEVLALCLTCQILGFSVGLHAKFPPYIE